MSSSTQTPATSKPSTAVTSPSSSTPEPKANGTPTSTAKMTLPNATYSSSDRLTTLRAQAATLDEGHYIRKVNTTASMAEALFYAKFPSFEAARKAIAPTISLEEMVNSLAVQLVLTTQLLETRRVRKDIAHRAIAKRRDGFSDGTMQEVWDEAWEEMHREQDERKKKEQEVRDAKRAARANKYKDGEGEFKWNKKNGSKKDKERRDRERVVEGGAGKGKDSFPNGGVNCGVNFFEKAREEKEKKR